MNYSGVAVRFIHRFEFSYVTLNIRCSVRNQIE